MAPKKRPKRTMSLSEALAAQQPDYEMTTVDRKLWELAKVHEGGGMGAEAGRGGGGRRIMEAGGVRRREVKGGGEGGGRSERTRP